MWQITAAWYYFQFFVNIKCLQCLVIHATSILSQNSTCNYIRNSSPYSISYFHIWKRGASDFLHFSGKEYDWNLAEPTYPWGILSFELFLQRPAIWRNVFQPKPCILKISHHFQSTMGRKYPRSTNVQILSLFAHSRTLPFHSPNSCK